VLPPLFFFLILQCKLFLSGGSSSFPFLFTALAHCLSPFHLGISCRFGVVHHFRSTDDFFFFGVNHWFLVDVSLELQQTGPSRAPLMEEDVNVFFFLHSFFVLLFFLLG